MKRHKENGFEMARFLVVFTVQLKEVTLGPSSNLTRTLTRHTLKVFESSQKFTSNSF